MVLLRFNKKTLLHLFIVICFFRYINALEADGKFSAEVSRTMLRKPDEVKEILKPQENRTSNCKSISGSWRWNSYPQMESWWSTVRHNWTTFINMKKKVLSKKKIHLKYLLFLHLVPDSMYRCSNYLLALIRLLRNHISLLEVLVLPINCRCTINRFMECTELFLMIECTKIVLWVNLKPE